MRIVVAIRSRKLHHAEFHLRLINILPRQLRSHDERISRRGDFRASVIALLSILCRLRIKKGNGRQSVLPAV
jgi:hypothetical protein